MRRGINPKRQGGLINVHYTFLLCNWVKGIERRTVEGNCVRMSNGFGAVFFRFIFVFHS